jgi:hypothetical protein
MTTIVNSPSSLRPSLPPLPLEEWEQTKETLHLWVQIVGKIRMATSPPRNHWWHVPLYLDIRGLTTRRLHAADGTSFQINFDFVDHRLVVRTSRGETESFALVDNLSVAAFDERLHATLRDLGVDVAIRETPYGIPTTTPFPQDVEHAAYDPRAVERFWRILDWTDGVFESFSGWYCGKTSPVHLFWHSLDLAVTRFDGERSPDVSALRPVDREAYSHNVLSFGFWAGDRDVREPTFYAYAAPEPAGLRAQALRPDEARWVERAGGSLALLAYEAVRAAPDPRRTLLAFLESAYQAGAGLGGWDRRELASTWCPPAGELHDLVGG